MVDLQVRREYLIGKEGDGLAILNSGLDLLRLWLAAVSMWLEYRQHVVVVRNIKHMGREHQLS